MKKHLCTGLALAAFSLAAPAQDWKAAVEKLPAYDFGHPRTFLVPLDEAVRTGGKDAADRKAIEKALAGVISGEATIEAKRYALRALGPLASAESVGAIAALVNDGNLGDVALWALERISDPAAGKALVDGLAAANDDRKVAFILALGWRKEASAIEPLSKLLSGANEAFSIAAADALARIDSIAACPAIREARENAPGRLRAALSNAALRCAERMIGTKEDKAAAIAIYTELMGEAEPSNVRAAALNGLVKAEPEKALERVVQALSSKDADLALVAAGFVRELPGPEATQAFTALLGEAPNETKAILIDALADRGDKSARAAIVASAESADDAVKLAAMKSLGRLGSAEDAPALLMLTMMSSGDMKRAAQISLNTLPGEGVNAALASIAAKGDSKLRSAAITALTERRARDVRGDLIKLLDDADAAIRGDVHASLEVLGEAADLPVLLARFSGAAQPGDVPALEKVIAAISNRIPAEDQRAAAVIAELANAAGTEHRASLLRVLGAIPTETSLGAIRDAMMTDDAIVRQAAVSALAAWPNGASLADLEQIAKAPPSDGERAAALAGYVRLLRESKDFPVAEQLKRYSEALGAAANAGEKKQIIAGLATVPSKQAIDLLEGLKADADLANDASSGVVSVVRLISGAFPAYAKEKLAPYAAEGAAEAIKKPAQAALALIGGFQDYLTAWEVSGPYFEGGQSGRDLFDKAFAPESTPETANWRIVQLANAQAGGDLKPWAIDLDAALGGQERVAYLRTTLNAETAQDAILELGTNDGCKVWFNGKPIHGFKEGRPLSPGQDKLPVHLEQGKNTVLIAVYQHGGQWAACARLADEEGKAVGGVKASVE
jgi:HEAT repeat protein